jgi:hypothetical protein
MKPATGADDYCGCVLGDVVGATGGADSRGPPAVSRSIAGGPGITPPGAWLGFGSSDDDDDEVSIVPAVAVPLLPA